MAAKKDFLGLVDAGRKIRRSPLVGMEFLHQRAMRAGDGVRARAGLQAKDLIGLLLPSFCRWTRQAAPLPCHRARVHASRAPGGQDTPSVARGFPRRFRSSKPTSVLTSRRSSVDALMAAGEDAAAHRAAVVVELHLEKGRAHARGLAGALVDALREARRAERQPAEQAEPENAERQRDRRAPRAGRGTRQSRARRCRRRPSCTRAPIFGSTLEMTLSAQSASTSTTMPKTRCGMTIGSAAQPLS